LAKPEAERPAADETHQAKKGASVLASAIHRHRTCAQRYKTTAKEFLKA
jgi:hypothetical protein